MKFVPNKRGIPRCFSRHPKAKGILAEADIRPTPFGRLAAKLLVFDAQKSMRAFWKAAISGDLGSGCLGAVNGLYQEVIDCRKGKPKPAFLRGDPRYFCVIGLCVKHLRAEVVSHECVHAGFCYEKRVKRNMFAFAGDFDEERIAYPAGRIAGAINDFLHRKRLYPTKQL